MNIYKVSRSKEWEWDEFDAFVCFAENEEIARHISPIDTYRYIKGHGWQCFGFCHTGLGMSKAREWHDVKNNSNWPDDFETLVVELIGFGDGNSGVVIIASFNAG